MVKEIEKEGRKLFACEVCSFAYADKATADECEAFCKSHGSCSMEITKKAVAKA